MSQRPKVNTLSSYLSIPHRELQRLGIFDAIVDRDSPLCIDPQLLFSTRMPELKGARTRVDGYFAGVIKLIKASTRENDLPWREALRRLTFKEEPGVAIGVSGSRRDGNGIGPVLAQKLLKTGRELIALGIEDPDLFELLPLFEEGFGADRLSDMAISLLLPDLERLNIRLTRDLRLRQNKTVIRDGQPVRVATYQDGAIIKFLPFDILRPVPIATDFESIDMAADLNEELRSDWNSIVQAAIKNKTEVHKSDVRRLFVRRRDFLAALLEAYRQHEDINEREIESALATGRVFANENPLSLPKSPRSAKELRTVIEAMVGQFKKCIEVNGLWNHLYRKINGASKPLHERFSQLLFFSIADSYCTANNVDLSREPNAGSGSVDFKLSHGRAARYLLEIKLSSHKALVHGYESQLPMYQESEDVDQAGLMIIRVNNSMSRINQVISVQREHAKRNQRAPDVYIVDGRIKLTASNETSG